MSNSFFSGPKPSASHALVDFGDEGTTIVPFSRIVGGRTEKGRCSVKWPDSYFPHEYLRVITRV